MEDLYVAQDFLLNVPINTIGIITGQVPKTPSASSCSKRKRSLSAVNYLLLFDCLAVNMKYNEAYSPIKII